MKQKKIVKPIDIDAHFKYRCPKCGIDHWVSLKEAKIKSFKVVCDCGKIFSPKQISKIKILYKQNKKKSRDASNTISSQQQVSSSPSNCDEKRIDINKNILEKCSTILTSYGFTKSEAVDLIQKTYYSNPEQDVGSLVKLALKSLGESTNE